jgi:hypothetical protein
MLNTVARGFGQISAHYKEIYEKQYKLSHLVFSTKKQCPGQKKSCDKMSRDKIFSGQNFLRQNILGDKKSLG